MGDFRKFCIAYIVCHAALLAMFRLEWLRIPPNRAAAMMAMCLFVAAAIVAFFGRKEPTP